MPVVLLASLGRSVGDFDELGDALVTAGYRVVAVELHGVGGSPLPAPGSTLHDLAADVLTAIVDASGEPVHLVGHAFGNRVARCVSGDRPELVRSVTVLGCGGKVPAAPDAHAALLACFDASLDPGSHGNAVATAFFAAGNYPPTSWLAGWNRTAAAAQGATLARTETDDWWVPPASLPVLAMVGIEDRISPPANARGLVELLGTRGKLVEIARAGHALLPEQPDAVERALLEHLSAW